MPDDVTYYAVVSESRTARTHQAWHGDATSRSAVLRMKR